MLALTVFVPPVKLTAIELVQAGCDAMLPSPMFQLAAATFPEAEKKIASGWVPAMPDENATFSMTVAFGVVLKVPPLGLPEKICAVNELLPGTTMIVAPFPVVRASSRALATSDCMTT